MRYITVLLLVCVFGAGCRTYRPPAGCEQYIARLDTPVVAVNDVRLKLAKIAEATNSTSRVEVGKSTVDLDQLVMLRSINTRLFEILILQGCVLLGVCIMVGMLNSKGKAG